ncbi:MAG: hypothetical protein ACJ8AT_17720 [Hyalangium sp.]|uniref:hypothetical protein n=1 Tax=Hyalangium sp. TaxID=2028555 RepID=UPI00389A25DC
MRVRTCAWRHCRRVFFLCARCNRGNLYCSRSCAQRARRVSLRAAGQRYQRSRRGRFKHAARQASYRQRRRALQKVTHPSTQEPPTLGNVVSPTENTKHTLIPLSAGREHATKPQEFGSEQAGAAARATRQGASAGLSGRLMGASGGEEGARATTSLESPRPEWQCIRCQRSLSALRQTLLAVALPSDRA